MNERQRKETKKKNDMRNVKKHIKNMVMEW